MNSPNHGISRWFRGSGASPSSPAESGKVQRISRRSMGLGEFMRSLRSAGQKSTDDEKLCILDLGSTSPSNIAFLTELGMRVFTEDVLRSSTDPQYLARQDDGTEQFDAQKFLAENLAYPDGRFDAVLFWDATDYLPEPLVKPLVDRIHTVLKPHGILLAFFHDKDVGPDAPFYRYHIAQPDTVEMEPKPGFRLQRIFQNRHVENLFANFASRKFFLGRDNFREVIVVR
jgi:SAM-dependent methyltransferase